MWLMFCLAGQSLSEPDLVLTILHTNDLHAHDEPFIERGREVGGLARIGHLIRSIRQTTPNVLAIDAGDIFQGTPFFKFYHGAAEVGLLNMIGYDIYTPGNHEFDDGVDNLTKQLQQAKFDVVSANLDTSAAPELSKVVKSSVVKVIDGRKVGFVGAICPDLESISLTTGKVHIKDAGDNWVRPIQQEVSRLKAEGVTRIILVTHVGVDRDKQLAEAIPEVDAIIGGHSHTRLDKPIAVVHPDGTETVIVQTGCYGKTLGKLKLAFDRAGHLIPEQVNYRLISIGPRIFQDKDIVSYLSERAGPIRELREKTAGVAGADFDNRFAQYPWDSPLGDLVTDAIADAGASYGASISFENRGGMRGRLAKGPVTLEEIEEILPFENHLLFATVSGRTVIKALEHSLSKGLGGPFFDVHGLKVAYNPLRESGSRVVFAMAADERGRWHDIDPEGKYKIAINDYSFNSGEGYDFSGATNIQTTQDRLATAFARYLSKKKEVIPEPPCRIVPITDHLLSTVKHGDTQFLQLQCGIPRARLTLVAGSWPGVDTVEGALPVPLTGAHIVDAKAVADAHGDYSWTLPLPPVKETCSVSGQRRKQVQLLQDRWASVIVNPSRTARSSKVLISYPVSLNAETQTNHNGGH